MDTGIIRVPLNELRTNDEQTIGSEYQERSSVWRWQKNVGATALKAKACCLQVITSVIKNYNTRVIAPDGAGPTTGIVTMPAGMPMSSIGKSGSDTGAYGWVQCKGPAKVTLLQSSGGYKAGAMAVGTSSKPATFPWGRAIAPMSDVAVQSTMFVVGRRIVLIESMAVTAVDTAVSAVVDLQCM